MDFNSKLLNFSTTEKIVMIVVVGVITLSSTLTINNVSLVKRDV